MIVDDHILLASLVGKAPSNVQDAASGLLAAGVYTTNYYYYRLCRALLAGSTEGQFSGRLAEMPDEVQQETIRLVQALPPAIQIAPLRDLVPTMAEVSRLGATDVL